MISQKIQKEFNLQINKEIFSSYLYLSMSSYFNSLNLSGFENWMRVQAEEELAHAMKFYHFITERGGRVILDSINKPESEWESPLKAFEEILKHECFVTESINNLVAISREEKDYASEIFLHWFVTEQVEEEATAYAIVEKLKLIGSNPNAVLMLDAELGKRIYTPPTSTKEI